MRATTSSVRRRAAVPLRSSDPRRVAAERAAVDELEGWRERAIPVANAPREGEALVRLFPDCVAALHLDPAIAADFTVATVHYYRRKDIIDPPDGRTAAARYHRRHLWQIASARLAGYLGLVTLAEARDAIRSADAHERPRPLPGVRMRSDVAQASLISLPDGVMCVLPAEHAAVNSRAASVQ